nr:hypothetical protein [Trichoderma atroviride]
MRIQEHSSKTKTPDNFIMSETMRAIDIKGDIGPAEALYMAEIPKPVPKEAQALVRVKAFGLNRADIMQRDGEYPVPPWAGKIMGLEFSGIIEALGENSEPSFKVGDEVFSLTYGGKKSTSGSWCENSIG